MSEDRRNWIKAGRASSIGLVLVVAVVLGYLLGSWLDRVFGTEPLLTLVFTIIGVVSGFVEMIRIAVSLTKDE